MRAINPSSPLAARGIRVMRRRNSSSLHKNHYDQIAAHAPDLFQEVRHRGSVTNSQVTESICKFDYPRLFAPLLSLANYLAVCFEILIVSFDIDIIMVAQQYADRVRRKNNAQSG